MSDRIDTMYVQNLKAFHAIFNHVMNETPTIPYPKTKELRKRLLEEEHNELQTAIDEDDMVKIADGLADLLYVTFGTAVTYGIPIDSIFGEVHASNMTKSGPNDEYGKTMKGDRFQPPRIREILRRHGWI